jgi:hypothetical protein
MPYFISDAQIWDWINIQCATMKSSQTSFGNYWVSIAPPPQLARLQIGEWEMQEVIKLHI